jgi:cell division protein FtsN
MWLLFPGSPVSGTAARPPAKPAAPTTLPPITSTVVIPAQPAPRPVQPPAPQSPKPQANVPATPVLQTGAFSSEANARTHAESLRKAGFTATITRKQVNGADRWAVTVPAGQNPNKTMQELKKAGFDSFPVK